MSSGPFHTAVLFDLGGADDLEATFREALGRFPEIEGLTALSFGRDDRGRAEPYTHCMIAHFASREAYDAYLVHPLHQAVVGLIQEKNVQVASMSFWPAISTGS